METKGLEKIEYFLGKEDPYTFVMLTLDIGEALEENRQETEQLFTEFEEMLLKKLSSGTILLRFEEDVYLAFAPFILDKMHLMRVFERLQQEYSERLRDACPKRKAAVAIGCIIGERQTTLEQLSETAGKLVAALRKQGRHGYKIMEQN